MAGTRKPSFFYGYVVVVASFLIMVIAWGTFYTFGIFFEPLLVEFGWSRTVTSGAFSLCTLLCGLLAMGAGRLTDTIGPRLVMIGCGVFLGLGYLLMSVISTTWQLYLLLGVVIGIGMSASYAPLLSTVARWFATRRGLVTGIVVSGIGLGTMIMPPVARWLISNHGWRNSYIIIGATVLTVIVLAAQFLRRDPGQMEQLPYGEGKVKQKSVASEAEGFSLQEAIRAKQFWLLLTMFFCSLFIINAITVHIVIHATGLGISGISAANILAIFGGTSIVGRIATGALADRFGNKLPMIFGFILMSVALLWLLVAREVWMFYLFAVILAFGYGGLITLFSPMSAELFGLSSHSAILGAVAFGGGIGEAIGPVLAGRIFDVYGSYQIAFGVCAAAGLVGLIMVSLLRPVSEVK